MWSLRKFKSGAISNQQESIGIPASATTWNLMNWNARLGEQGCLCMPDSLVSLYLNSIFTHIPIKIKGIYICLVAVLMRSFYWLHLRNPPGCSGSWGTRRWTLAMATGVPGFMRQRQRQLHLTNPECPTQSKPGLNKKSAQKCARDTKVTIYSSHLIYK